MAQRVSQVSFALTYVFLCKKILNKKFFVFVDLFLSLYDFLLTGNNDDRASIV